ncbi:hypothetical protein DPMN_035303 [Dreissena polymorpha]|uniref:Uncharacterized protein n=1 Tax=Dreissena polymorpha TaxID=45954 RepID=A0A9D4M7A6_DREPO|nr:hypothetical protein DPMN_035303 [Dreissena polymorpha]
MAVEYPFNDRAQHVISGAPAAIRPRLAVMKRVLWENKGRIWRLVGKWKIRAPSVTRTIRASSGIRQGKYLETGINDKICESGLDGDSFGHLTSKMSKFIVQ